jgi:hypothetical protein
MERIIQVGIVVTVSFRVENGVLKDQRRRNGVIAAEID